MLNFSVRRRA